MSRRDRWPTRTPPYLSEFYRRVRVLLYQMDPRVGSEINRVCLTKQHFCGILLQFSGFALVH